MTSPILRLATFVSFLLIATNAYAATDNALPVGDPGKGRYVFRKCIACHKNNKITLVCPDAKTKQEWKDFFQKNLARCKHVQSRNNFAKYDFTDIQLSHVLGFLIKYAKDSEEKFTMCK